MNHWQQLGTGHFYKAKTRIDPWVTPHIRFGGLE